MKEIQFAQKNDMEWQEAAIKSLRGIPFEKLRAESLEGITLDPLYTKESYEAYFKGNDTAFVSQVRVGKQDANWTIAQASYARTGAGFLQEVKETLEKGNEAIVYDGKRPISWEQQDLEELADLVKTYPVFAIGLDEKDEFCTLFSAISQEDRGEITGIVTGIQLPNGYGKIRTHCADMIDFHMGGADAVTELALAVALAVKEADGYTTFGEFADQFSVRFAIDTNFFMEIAKLRAFRVLMSILARAYETEPVAIPIMAETSLRTYTKFDAHTNLLRAGNEVFASALGGADVMTVHPHTILGEVTPASIRTARNVQIIIREETFADVLDPAGGSYYLDILTDQLVQKAWSLFQSIDKHGGYDAYIATEEFKRSLKQTYDKRLARLNTGKDTLVGTTNYAEPTQQISENATVDVTGRLAAPFEKIRLEGVTGPPRTVIVQYGTLAECKPRTDFVSGFLAVGGIQAELSPVFSDVQDTVEWLQESTYDYYIICTAPEQVSAIEQIVAVATDKWMDVAGRFDHDVVVRLKEVGVNGFIYRGQKQLEKLTAIYHGMGKAGAK